MWQIYFHSRSGNKKLNVESLNYRNVFISVQVRWKSINEMYNASPLCPGSFSFWKGYVNSLAGLPGFQICCWTCVLVNSWRQSLISSSSPSEWYASQPSPCTHVTQPTGQAQASVSLSGFSAWNKIQFYFVASFFRTEKCCPGSISLYSLRPCDAYMQQ